MPTPLQAQLQTEETLDPLKKILGAISGIPGWYVEKVREALPKPVPGVTPGEAGAHQAWARLRDPNEAPLSPMGGAAVGLVHQGQRFGTPAMRRFDELVRQIMRPAQDIEYVGPAGIQLGEGASRRAGTLAAPEAKNVVAKGVPGVEEALAEGAPHPWSNYLGTLREAASLSRLKDILGIPKYHGMTARAGRTLDIPEHMDPIEAVQKKLVQRKDVLDPYLYMEQVHEAPYSIDPEFVKNVEVDWSDIGRLAGDIGRRGVIPQDLAHNMENLLFRKAQRGLSFTPLDFELFNIADQPLSLQDILAIRNHLGEAMQNRAAGLKMGSSGYRMEEAYPDLSLPNWRAPWKEPPGSVWYP